MHGTFRWRTGKNASIVVPWTWALVMANLICAYGITINPLNGELFVADYYQSHRIQVLDKNGSFVRKFVLWICTGQL